MSDPATSGECTECLQRVLVEHLGHDPDSARRLARRFSKVLTLEPFKLYDKRRDPDALDRMSRGISEIERAFRQDLTVPARLLLGRCLAWGGSADVDKRFAYFQENGAGDIEILEDFFMRATAIRTAVDEGRREIEASNRGSFRRRQIKTDRLNVTELAAVVWKKVKSSDLPKKEIKPAHPFASFLGDLFGCLGIESTPEKAFMAWRRHKTDPPLP